MFNGTTNVYCFIQRVMMEYGIVCGRTIFGRNSRTKEETSATGDSKNVEI